MNTPVKRIAVNVGGGFVPGINAIVTGVVLAASRLGWEIVSIRDGFDGLLFPDRYPEGGLERLTVRLAEALSASANPILGNATRTDPFRVRHVVHEHQVEEVDRSGELLKRIVAQGIDAVISIVSPQAMSVAYRLHKLGLPMVCVPVSTENDVAATQLAFGFNSALSFTVDVLERVRQAAQAARKIGVVEVPGERAGWLALQAGMAVCADAALIPEMPSDLQKVAASMRARFESGRTFGLVVVAEGARFAQQSARPVQVSQDSLRAMLSPGASFEAGSHVIETSGKAARAVALELQRLTDHPTYPLALGPLVKGGPPTAVDRQLGLGYGAGAVRAVQGNESGVMVAFQPPELKYVPLSDAINSVRTIPPDSVFIQTARSLGISLGD